MSRDGLSDLTPDQLSFIKEYKSAALEALSSIEDACFLELVRILSEARDQNRQIFLCGNGGSAATASHFANDLGKTASLEASARFRVLSLTDNVSWITALANDLDYRDIFVEQLKNYAQPKDVLIAFSGSGDSENVLHSVEWANQNDLLTVGITGFSGGKLAQNASVVIQVGTDHMGHIEEGHFFIQHLLTYFFMEQGIEDSKGHSS